MVREDLEAAVQWLGVQKLMEPGRVRAWTLLLQGISWSRSRWENGQGWLRGAYAERGYARYRSHDVEKNLAVLREGKHDQTLREPSTSTS